MKLEQLKGKKILIVGYGKEGKATEMFLKTVVPTAVIGVTDMKDGENYLGIQQNFDLAIKSPGVKKELITIPYTTATNIFFANVKGMVIGVTGSKGKSTTSSLIYEILKTAGKQAHLVGNIGNPALLELLKSNTENDIFVYELSSYQLDDVAYSPRIAVVLNLFPEHMNYHGSVEMYYRAKRNIIEKLGVNDYFVYHGASQVLGEWATHLSCKRCVFEESPLAVQGTLPLKGRHNRDNMNAAITVAHILGIPDLTVSQALGSFTPLPHRLQCIGTYRGITFYDDAISTTPDSTIAAIETLAPVDTIFLGGLNRGYDFDVLAQKISEKNIAHIVLFPDSGTDILRALKKHHKPLPDFLETNSMEEAVIYAYKVTKEHTICLLSTASPSYSLWNNFEEKGDQFTRYVKQYADDKGIK